MQNNETQVDRHPFKHHGNSLQNPCKQRNEESGEMKGYSQIDIEKINCEIGVKAKPCPEQLHFKAHLKLHRS